MCAVSEVSVRTSQVCEPCQPAVVLPGEDGQPCIPLLTYAMPVEYLCLKEQTKTKHNNENHNSSKELHELGLIQLLSLTSSGGVHGGASGDNSAAISACSAFSWDFRLSSECTLVTLTEENHL